MLSIIPLTGENVSAIVGYAGTIISDLMPLLIVIIGIAIGVWIIKAILSLRG